MKLPKYPWILFWMDLTALRGSDQSRHLDPPNFDLHEGPDRRFNPYTIIGPKKIKNKKKIFKSQLEGSNLNIKGLNSTEVQNGS